MKKQKTNIPKGYKQSKLGLIPIDWEEIAFNDLADSKVKWSITGGPFGSDLKSVDYTNTGVQVIQLQNLGDGHFIDENKIYTSEAKADSLLACNIYPGEIILSKMGDPVARASIIPNKEKRYLMGSDGIRLVVNQTKFDKLFVKEYINYSIFRNTAISHSTGSTRQRIGLKDLKKLPFSKPPLPEQQKIAEILSTWDKAIEKTDQLIKKLIERKKGLMQELLTGKKRLPGYAEKWKEVELGDITKRVTKKNTELNDTVVSISAQKGLIRQEEYFTKRVASNILSDYYLLEQGQFAYNKSYSNGYPMGAFKRLDKYEKGVVTTLYICFSCTNKVDSDFLLNYFEAGLMTRDLMKVTKEGGRAHGLLNIGLKDFFKLPLRIPNLKEQNKISNLLVSSENEISNQIKYLDKLNNQKKALMQQLLTGQLRVKV